LAKLFRGLLADRTTVEKGEALLGTPFDPIAPKLSPSKSEVADIELRIQPLRFSLVTFKSVWTDEIFYPVVLPDGTVIEPQEEERA
jgi:hypothetical protein